MIYSVVLFFGSTLSITAKNTVMSVASERKLNESALTAPSAVKVLLESNAAAIFTKAGEAMR